MYGIISLGIVAGRAEPAHKSEMVTQLFMGDTFEILLRDQKWIKIKNSWDSYECWIDQNQYQELSENEYHKIQELAPTYTGSIHSMAQQNGGTGHVNLVMGTSLPFYNGKQFKNGKTSYNYDGTVFNNPQSATREDIVKTAFLYLNTPYLWGGKSHFGIDCSGFTQMVFKLNGKKLPRDAWQQAALGSTISFVEEARPGDLAFFDNDQGRIIHVGIILEDKKIIHARGKVRIDELDHQGIYQTDKKTYSHNLRLIKTYPFN